MKNKITFILATLFLIFFTAAGRVLAFSVSYDQKVSVDHKPVATIQTVVQDHHMRAESVFNGMRNVMLRNETGVYSYMPDQKMATKIPASMDKPNLTRDLPHFMDFLQKNGGEKIGAEKINGQDCEIYKFTEPNIKTQAKAWVWTEKQFPVKVEVPSPDGLTTIEMSNIKFDPAIDAAQFQLPADVKVLDLEAAQKMASQAQQPAS